MNDEHHVDEFTEDERRLLSLLPRESEPSAQTELTLLATLREDGFFHARSRRTWPLQAVAALLLLLLGGWIGAQWSQRNSLEALLEQHDLNPQERVLLLQRAGSAYVRAAQSYAVASSTSDAAALEVARRVLIGAAQAVARNGLDRGLSVQLTNLLQPNSSPPVIWF